MDSIRKERINKIYNFRALCRLVFYSTANGVGSTHSETGQILNFYFSEKSKEALACREKLLVVI